MMYSILLLLIIINSAFIIMVLIAYRNLAFSKDGSLTSGSLTRFERCHMCLRFSINYQQDCINSVFKRHYSVGRHSIGDELIEVEVGIILAIEKGSEFTMDENASVIYAPQYFAILGGQTVCRVYEPVQFENGIRGWVVSITVDSTRVFINGPTVGIVPGQIVRARKHPWWNPEPFQPAMWLSPEHFF